MPTEVTILGLSGVVWLRILFGVAVAVFLWRMSRLIRVLAMGKWENRFDHLPLRTWTFLKEVMGQARMFQEPIIGWAHPLIFWGFCLFVIASALMLTGGMFPDWPIPQAEEIPVLGMLIDLFAVIVTAALIASSIRRYVFTPPGLQRTLDASIVVVLIAALMVTYVLAEAGGVVEGAEVRLPAGEVAASLMVGSGMRPAAVTQVGHVAWWIHALILLGFLVYLPFSKHMHLMWAPVAVFFGELPDKGTLPPAEDAEDVPDRPMGQLTWRMLLSGYACAECGRCERVCPAFQSGSKLSPREILHDLKSFVLDEGFSTPHARADENDRADDKAMLGGRLTPEVLWGCTSCYACMDRCPVRNEHVPLIVQMRRRLVEQGQLDAGLQDALTALQRYGNSLGKSPRRRLDWAKDLSEPIKDARKEPVDMLWFLGDYAAYHASSVRVSQKVAQVFQRAGIDFGVLHQGEKSSGNDVRRVGEEGLFEMLAEQNMKVLGKATFQQIVTTDPHTYHALKHEYGRFGLHAPVLHYSELLDQWIRDGTLKLVTRLFGVAVYHDPCYLGRYNGIYEPPRRVIDAVGLHRVEMPRNRKNSYCCGAGGGKLWMEEESGVTERPAVNRIREALDMDGVDYFVVACPKDLGMFEDAVKTLGAEDRLEVVDLGELVFEAIENANSDGVRRRTNGRHDSVASKVGGTSVEAVGRENP